MPISLTHLMHALIAFAAIGTAHPASARDQAASATATDGATTPADPPAAHTKPSRFHLTAGTDFTTAYFFRGIRQEDSGLIAQPYADLAIDAFRGEDATASMKAGMWHSIHDKRTLSTTKDNVVQNWYEADFYLGVGLTAGRWTFDARYVWYTSPNGAFGTVHELDLSVAFDDSDFLGKWAFKPSATIAREIGSNAADGGNTGTYLQLGVAPGFTIDAMASDDLAITFPATLGLSLDDYYESGTKDEMFGYASIGAKASISLPVDQSWGTWTLSAGVQTLFLGDTMQDLNRGKSTELIGTIGVSVSF